MKSDGRHCLVLYGALGRRMRLRRACPDSQRISAKFDAAVSDAAIVE
jgi:hypothetical protein